jgi:hypothetical protein
LLAITKAMAIIKTPTNSSNAATTIEIALGILRGASKTATELIAAATTSDDEERIGLITADLEEVILKVDAISKAAKNLAANATTSNTPSSNTTPDDNTSDEERQAKRRRVESDAEGVNGVVAKVEGAVAAVNVVEENSDNASTSDNTSNSGSAGNSDNASDSTYSDEVELNQPVSFSRNPIDTLRKELKYPMLPFMSLGVFNLGELPDCDDIDLDFVAKQVNKLKNASVEINKLGEIGRYPLITPILTEIVEKFKNMKHHAQYPLLEGTVARGYPDWALLYDNSPIFIVEAKRDIDDEAIAQTVLQMYEAHMEMRQEGDIESWEMYGMVTTAVKVIFLKAVFTREHCTSVEWNGGVLYIPHDKMTTDDKYKGGVKPIFQYLKAILSKLTGGPAAAHNIQQSQP